MRNTSLTGEVSRTQVMAALALQGRKVLVPLADYHRYDLVLDEGDHFLRIQCKTGRLTKGAVVFHPCSINSRSKRGGCIRTGYKGQVELFGVYCPELRKCYLIPVEEAPVTGCYLRINPPRNGQKTKIRWAMDYEILT